MENKREIIQRIPSWYIGEDCAHVMIPYKNAITILNKDGIVYHHKEGSGVYINKYLEDGRRKQFPYHNIPMYYTKFAFDGTYHYANQLFEFDQPYIRINDGLLIESYVVKDKKEAVAINKILPFIGCKSFKTRSELDKLIEQFANANENERVYCIYLGGTMPINNKFTVASESEISDQVKEMLLKNANDLRKYVADNPCTVVGNYFQENPSFLNFVDSSLQNFELNRYNVSVELTKNNTTMLFARTNGNDIKMQGMDLVYCAPDYYKVTTYDIPVTKYTLEQLKFLTTKIEKIPEPKISLKDNPGVTKEDIKLAKRMIKTKKNL